jgi:molecular chaperone DnaK (HSP70)
MTNAAATLRNIEAATRRNAIERGFDAAEVEANSHLPRRQSISSFMQLAKWHFSLVGITVKNQAALRRHLTALAEQRAIGDRQRKSFSVAYGNGVGTASGHRASTSVAYDVYNTEDLIAAALEVIA